MKTVSIDIVDEQAGHNLTLTVSEDNLRPIMNALIRCDLWGPLDITRPLIEPAE
jgi:hypothetical protein